MSERAGGRWIWAAALLLFLAGAGLRVQRVHLHRLDTFQATSDEAQYLRLSSSLLKGRGFTESREPPWTPSTLRVPGYPLFLAGAAQALGAEVNRMRALQAVLDLLTGMFLACVAYAAARRGAAAREPAGVLAAGAGGLWMVAAPTLEYVPLFYTEVLAAFLAIAAAGLFLRGCRDGARAGWMAGAGLLLALLTLTRPAQLVWLPAGLACALVAPRPARWKRGAAFLLGALLPLCAWSARNLAATGRPVFLSTIGSGMNLWVGTRSDGAEVMAPVLRDGERQWIARISFGDSEEEKRQAQLAWNTYMGGLLGGGDPGAVERADRDLRDLGVAAWKRHFGRSLALRVRNAVRNLSFGEGPGVPWRILAGAPFWLAALLVMWRAWKRRDGALLFLSGAPWVLWAAHFPLHTETRYLFPAWPLLLAATAALLARKKEEHRDTETQRDPLRGRIE